MAKILVTGGAGFIGSHIVEEALKKGHKVRILDNLSSGKLENLFTDAEFINGDITDQDVVKESLIGIDYVLHFAAQASVVVSTKDPLLDSSINVGGTVNLLEQSLKSDVKHFIFASTGGAIYGNVKDLPALESSKIAPLAPYGVSKAAAEIYCDYFNRLGLPISILRFANVYGPRQDAMGEAGVISIFLGNINAGKSIIVYGDGTTTRDYIFVKDIAKFCLQILENPLQKAFNIGTGKETPLLDLIDIIQKVTKIDPKKVNKPLREGEVEKICLDITQITKKTSWKPETGLKDGISEVWKWIKT
ncbi:MAG: NAD-dependent epimerase/dehydratase family protein [Candidatus Hodarchaeales archaeon]|jgi:UDP-glucose 4-epimerase